MDSRLREKIESMILNGERIKEVFDMDSPIDRYILERLAYYRFVIPLMTQRGTNMLSEDDFNNCIIEMYKELKSSGRIHIYPQLPST